MKRTPIVIKVGGALLDDQAAMSRLLTSIQTVLATRPVILVHGGGPLVETLMASLGLSSNKIDGLRVTPDEHMPYICGALAGSANKTLCAAALQAGCTPVGLSLLDGNMVTCDPLDERFGAVGVPSAADPALLKSVLAQGLLPVVSSIGSSPEGRLLNINADQAATVIAELVQGELLLLSNVNGVLDGDKQLINTLDAAGIETFADQGIITDGMLVKVNAALLAATTLGRPVTIASWNAAISEILNRATGTQVFPSPLPSGDTL